MERRAGTVFLVGAGPGDPDLLTVKALRLLESAEVILYDRLVSPEILAVAARDAEFIYTGKEEGHQEEMQAQIFDLLLRHGRAGKRVVRLKGGDPFIFGRGGEEMMLLRSHGIEAEMVPGVTSAISAPALAGIPVTYRGIAHSFAIVSARCKGGQLADWERVARVHTLVVLMGVKYRDRIAQSLIDAGRPADEPVAFVERGTTAEERVIESTLGEVAGGRVAVEAPAVMVVGEVVRLRSALMTAASAAVGFEQPAPSGRE